MKLFKILLMLFVFVGMAAFAAGVKTEIPKQEIRGDTVAPVQVMEYSFCLSEKSAPELPPGFSITEKPRPKEPTQTNLLIHIDPG